MQNRKFIPDTAALRGSKKRLGKFQEIPKKQHWWRSF